VVVDDSYSLFKNTLVSVPAATGVLVNDSDAESDPLTAHLVSGPLHATAFTLNADGSFNYIPANNYVGPDNFTYLANDGLLDSAPATVSLSILATNTAPVAVNDSYSVNEDTTLIVPATGVLANDTDLDGDSLTATLVGTVTHGSLSLNSNGGFTYTPTANYHGPDGFTYRANDGLTNSGLATVSITVNSVNDAPIAGNQSVTTAEDTATNLVLTATDVDGDTLTFAVLVAPTNGMISLLNTNTGALTYTPNTNFDGLDSFTFTVFDGTLYATGTVSFAVTPVNDAPVAVDDSYSLFKNSLLSVPAARGVLVNDSDVEGDPLAAHLISGPLHATVFTLSADGSFNYTPANNYVGPDSFTYLANDGLLDSTPATVSLSIVATNTTPVAVNDSYSVNEDTTLIVPATGVLANDTDIDEDLLTATLVGTVSHGSLLLNPNGGFTYTPTANYHGPDSFTYRANDGLTNSGVATVSITVNSVNDAPIAANQSMTTPEDTATNLVLSATDVDGDTLIFAVLVGPTNGAISLLNTNTGALTYTPNTNFNGLDSFTFTAFDGSLYATGTVSITVTPVNDAPVTVDDSYSLLKNSLLSVPAASGVLVNDSDVESDPLTAHLISGPLHATAFTLNADGSVNYTPANNYVGPDSFTYLANDGLLDSAPATVSLNVVATNTAPVAVNDNYSVNEDTALIVPATGVLANDTDIDADSLTATLVGTVTHGLLSLNPNGGFTYTPTANYHGPDSFSYRANDGLTNSGVATVSITVNSVNDAPIAGDRSVTTPEDTATNLVLTATDVDGDTLTFAVLVAPTNGTLGVLNTNTGAMTYKPNTNFNGLDSFTFTAFDGSLYATGTVSITVTPVNDGPVVVDDSYSLFKNTLVSVPAATGVLVNDSDAEGDPLTAHFISGPLHATAFTLNADGSFNYTPAINYVGPDSFTYVANDGLLDSAPATVSLSIVATNTAPVAVNDSYSVNEDTTLVVPAIGVLANDTDIDGDLLTATLVGTVSHGSLSLNPNGGFTYTPAANYQGPDSFTYQANDGLTNSGVATVSITVNPVTPVHYGPTAADDIAYTHRNAALTIWPLANDNSPDGMALTISGVSPTNGTATIVGNTSVLFKPKANYLGNGTIRYTNSDGAGGKATALITVVVTNRPPIALNDSVTTLKNTPITILPLLNDSDPDGDTLRITSARGTQGRATIVGRTNVLFRPKTNFVGTANISYRISDGHGKSASAVITVNVTASLSSGFLISAGTNIFNPQTGLFEQRVTVTNTGTNTAAAVRLLVGGLRGGVALYDASGTNSGRPFVQYNAPLNPGQAVTFRLEFYVPDRHPFNDTLEAQAVLPIAPTIATGGVVIDRKFMDNRIPAEPRFVIEWASVPGRIYTVLYSSDMQTWTAATPSIKAAATRTQWYDDGPPKTSSKPADTSSRFYRVVGSP